VYSLDVRSGARTLVTTLPDGARVSFVSVGGGFLYALDTGAQTLYAIDLVTREVRPHYMAFGKSIVAMDIAVDGRLWFASSALGQLVSFDPRTERYDFVNRSGAKRLSAIYAQVLNKIWFAYPHGKDAVVGVYDTRWGVVDERTIDAGGDVTALFVDGNGTVWASSSTLGLISISGEALARVGSGPATNLGFALGADGSGWALQSDARGGRLGRLGGTSMPFPTTARGLFVDSYGRLWTADTANSGFYLVIAVTAP
jgi:streptogramin lyase